MSHSASSLCILTLDMQLQLSISGGQILFFLCFLLPKQETCNKDGRHLRDFVQLGGLGWGIGRLCGGVGARGWRHPQTPATPPSPCRGAPALISKFITSSANLSSTAGLPLTHSRQTVVCAAGTFEVRQRAQPRRCKSAQIQCSPPDAFRREYNVSTFTHRY